MSDSRRETKTYWRSLERLYDSPALQPNGDEFPEGASLSPSEVDRRTVMKLMGASLAMAGAAACRRPEERIVPYVNAPERIIPGVPLQFATTLTLGTNATGVLVESHEGRPTKIEGNELHPASGGAADSWTQAAILNLYDPDRSRNPVRRDENGVRQNASWADFEAAWQERAAGWQSDGAGLAVLAEESCSPTVARLAATLGSRYPGARWVSYDAVSDRNILDGLRQATGQAVRPHYRLDQADIVLSLDADLLATESGAVANARGLASRRRPSSGSDAMARLYVAESRLSLTGANADHRWAVPSRTIPALAAALAAELGVSATAPGDTSLPAGLSQAVRALAADLRAAGGRCLIAAGRNQPAAVHAVVYALNYALGAVGTAIDLLPADDLLYDGVEALSEVADALQDGSVTTLLILGGNPAYSVPAVIGLPAAIVRAEFSVHLGSHFDETSNLTTWHLPLSHPLESWADSRSADGSLAIGQPLIEPLFDSRSVIEVLGLVAADTPADAYTEVRTTWAGLLDGDFEQSWNRALHDGVSPAAAAFPGDLPPAAVDLSEAGGGSGLELVLFPSPSVYDGRFANNGWLQELPDPISKITWDNAVHISAADAAARNLSTGDIVTVLADKSSLDVPVWISPGQAEGSLALEIGYGRRHSGQVGKGVGVNATILPAVSGGVTLSPTGKSHELVQTQEHWQMEGRSLVRSATLAEFASDPEFATRPDEFTVDPLWAHPHDYSQGYQWGMTIDLSACTGCSACIVACQSENNIPIVGKEQVSRGREMHWLRVDRYYEVDSDDPASLANPAVVFQPVPCMHCENAPCEQVCPVAATVHDAEGINAMVYNRCIGTRYCSNNCPYKVRRFNYFNFTVNTPQTLQLANNPDVTVRSRGVMEKCSFCLQRISEARITSKSEGRDIADGEIRTACQQTCPSDAIVFGNINDPASRVSQLKANNRNYVLLAELYNRPRTSYLARVTNPNPSIGGGTEG